jgi:hypothetical protein
MSLCVVQVRLLMTSVRSLTIEILSVLQVRMVRDIILSLAINRKYLIGL